jgi:hypothetical protein
VASSVNGWTFTVVDLARLIGKSPVTIRGWEKKGLISLPRDSGDNRKLTCEDVRSVAKVALDLGRIHKRRYQLVLSTLYLLEQVEMENS